MPFAFIPPSMCPDVLPSSPPNQIPVERSDDRFRPQWAANESMKRKHARTRTRLPPSAMMIPTRAEASQIPPSPSTEFATQDGGDNHKAVPANVVSSRIRHRHHDHDQQLDRRRHEQ